MKYLISLTVVFLSMFSALKANAQKTDPLPFEAECNNLNLKVPDEYKNGYEVSYRNSAKTLCRFNKALKSRDKKLISKLISYPISRTIPLKSIKSAEEFIEHYDEFFDEKNTKTLIEASNSHKSLEGAGWRGFMILEGELWIAEGSDFVIINDITTDKQIKLAKDAEEKDRKIIYQSASKYNYVEVDCMTSKHHIRIHDILESDDEDNKVEYFSWEKDQNISSKPEISLKGIKKVEGSDNYTYFIFKNGKFTYTISDNEVDSGKLEDGQYLLTIEKNDIVVGKNYCSE